jgi:hypothetical protein
VLKDRDNNPALKGVGMLVWMFGLGLMSAMVAVAVFIPAWQRGLLNASASSAMWERRLMGVASAISALFVFIAIIVAIYKFGSL